MKTLHTRLHGTRYPGSRAKVRREAERVETWIKERAQMLASDEEWRGFLWRQHVRKWSDCRACPRHSKRCSVVSGTGSLAPRVVFLMGPPTRSEDHSGESLAGLEGSLLLKIFERVGLDREDAFVTHVVGCRHPWDREPERAQREACLPRLNDQLVIFEASVMVFMGPSAASWLFKKRPGGVERAVLRRRDWEGHDMPSLVYQNLRAALVTHCPVDVLASRGSVRKRKLLELTKDVANVKKIVDFLKGGES